MAMQIKEANMKHPKVAHNYFFVDESGDTTFYNKRGQLIVGQSGCSPILMMGFIETTNPRTLRRALMKLQKEVIQDPYFQGVPSLAKTAIAFHAKDDIPEIRHLVYKLLATLDFRAQIVVARKSGEIFQTNHHGKPYIFYDSLIVQLFQEVLHRHEQNSIIFAKRGSRNRQIPLQNAIQQASNYFEVTSNSKMTSSITIQVQRPQGELCLSIVDYVNWAVYRAFTQGEMRYYDAIADKVDLLVDLYDFDNYGQHRYSKRNPFHINKITPLRLGS